MKFKVDKFSANELKQAYLDSVNLIVEKKRAEADVGRTIDMGNIEKKREDFKKMLGWPLTEPLEAPKSAKRELLASEDGVNIYRIQLEIFEDFYFGGLYFEYEGEKLPLVVVQHGGLGSPELCSGLEERGSGNYRDMTERVLREKVHVFAPQLLLWEQTFYKIDFDRAVIDNRLKQVGGSISALEIYCIMSSISYFASQPSVEPERIGMVGMSYGGFYTLFTAAVDTRIKAAVSSGFFNDRYAVFSHDWMWKGSAEIALDAEAALLCYPRRLAIAVGKNDPLFGVKTAAKEYGRLLELIAEAGIGTDWLEYIEFDGVHEFISDNGVIERCVAELKK